MTSYDNDSIKALKGPDRVRKRPGVIFGSDGIEGAEHAYFEILSNSIDEARAGFGTQIDTILYEDGSIEVIDRGRGIPLDYNEAEGRYNWELVYTELYAGGKYDREGSYAYALGLNGLGACATQYASAYFDVEVVRDGHQYNLHFEKGEIVGQMDKKKIRGKATGTRQRFKLDREVFTSVDIPMETFEETLKRQAIVNAGITFTLTDAKGETMTFLYPEGILGYVEELNADEGLSTPYSFEGEGAGRDRTDRDEYSVRAQIAFCFNNKINAVEYYHNSSFLEHGGAPDKAARSALVSAIDSEIKARDKYQKNESKITYNDLVDSLIYVSSSFSSQTSYANQTKKAISNRFVQQFMTDLIKDRVKIWAIENRAEADRVVDQILANKRSRETAERQRVTIRKKLMGSVDNINNRVKKFVDCRSKDPEKCELYIVEGDSALGSVKLGRDAEYQAIMPVRGKILNCLKASLKSIFDSEIIVDLLKVIGAGVEIEPAKKHRNLVDFDLSRMRWHKVIICTDSDVDGFQIRTLILAMLHRLVPTLIAEGYVYIAETPLYEITVEDKKDQRTLFAYDDREKNRIIESLGDKPHTIQRSKGLGENDPEMMWETTMNPASRRLVRVRTEDAEDMEETFDLLLGNNLAGRKVYIAENGYKYIDEADLA